MREIVCEQGTPDWYRARAGHVTASRMAQVKARPGTKGRNNYLLELCLDLEGVEAWAHEDPEPWYQHGRQWEDWARGWYSWHEQRDGRTTGFVEYEPAPWLGCSPDWMLDPDGLLEIKCHKSLTQQRAAVAKASRPVIDQVQMQMLICGREWCDLLNYWRDLDHDLEQGAVQRIYPDEARQQYLMERATEFYNEVQALFEARNGRAPPAPYITRGKCK